MCEMISLIIEKKYLIHAYVFDCRELWCCERRKKNLVNIDRYFRKTAPNDTNWRGLVNNMMKNSSITR